MQRRRVFRLVVLGSLSSGRRFRTESISDRVLPGVPNPKFKFGDHVVCQWTNDDNLSPDLGKTFNDEGVIMGMIWNPNNWNLKGWVYWVRWVKTESDPSLWLGHTDEVHESDLQPVSIPFHFR